MRNRGNRNPTTNIIEKSSLFHRVLCVIFAIDLFLIRPAQAKRPLSWLTPQGTETMQADIPPLAQADHWGLGVRLLATLSALLLGMAIGLAALGLFSTVQFFNDLWRVPLPGVLGLEELSFSPAVGAALLVAALVSGQLLRFFENGRPHGPADLILGAQKNHSPNIKAGMLSSLLATVNLSGGASVGVFGPLVHFGGCLSALLARGFQPFTKAIPLDVVLGSGAAAAIAAVFSAPIGAAIMAHEAIIRRFGALGAGPVIAAAFGAHWAAQNLVGDHRMFSVQSSPAITVETFVTAIGLGIITGVLSVVYIHAVTAAPGWARSSKVPLVWRPLIPAAFLFLLSPLFPHLLGTGLGSVDLALAGKISLLLLVCLVALKILATSLCLGFGMFGGVFAPALFIGALTGAAFDSLLSGVMPAGSSFAMLGAACCIAAVIGAPLASIVIVFELTGSYEWAVLAMVSVVVSQQVSRAMAGRSLFDRQLQLRGVQLADDHPPDASPHASAADNAADPPAAHSAATSGKQS